MMGSNDTKFVAQLDKRLSSIIMEPQQSGDRGCLVAVLHVVNGSRPDKRRAVFDHFAKTIANRCKSHVARMRDVYFEIEAELANQPKTAGQLAYEDAMKRVAEARRSEALTVEQ
jgi:hypothetical protein